MLGICLYGQCGGRVFAERLDYANEAPICSLCGRSQFPGGEYRAKDRELALKLGRQPTPYEVEGPLPPEPPRKRGRPSRRLLWKEERDATQ